MVFLQKSAGNAAVSRALAGSAFGSKSKPQQVRDSGELADEWHLQRAHTEEKSLQRDPGGEPTGLSTEFGSFTVYPDDFIGPLPTSVRTADSWPIRETELEQLRGRLESVRDGTSKFTVNGTAAFKMQVYLDLGWLMTSGAGQELIQELQNASHAVVITQKAAGGNATSYLSNEDSYELPVSPATPGPGSDVEVRYNPAVLHIKDGTLAWHHRPPAIGLAHELVHAWTGVYGTRARYDEAGTNRRELQATGLGEFEHLRITENRFRREFGLPLRPEY